MDPPPPRSRLQWEQEFVSFTTAAQEKGVDAVAWAVRVSSILLAAEVEIPSSDLAGLLVDHVCWNHGVVPAAWKYLEKAVSARIVPPMLVIALLSTRVIPNRHTRPAAYRIYLEILKRHSFYFATQISGSNFQKTLMLIDDVLHLSQTFGLQGCEPGVLIVEFIFCIIWQLLDAALDDEGLLEVAPDKRYRWLNKSQDMEIDGGGNFIEKRKEYPENIYKVNTVMAIELIWQFLHHKVISRLLNLAQKNMYSHWQGFCQQLHLLATKSFTLRDSTVSPMSLLQLSLDNLSKVGRRYKPSQYKEFCALSSGPLASPGGYIHGASHSALWVPLDLYLEDAITKPVAATNAIEELSGLVKALQAVNRATWHDAFLGLWLSSLRLVQRERDPSEGPVPHVDTRMSMLLCITTLAVAEILEEEEPFSEINNSNQLNVGVVPGIRHKALVSSLQLLGDYEGLLSPPPFVVSAANKAATKAMMFISGLPVASGYYENIVMNDKTAICSGNMRHLIIDACIARNLLDTSAYFWPGYVNGCISQKSHILPSQASGWTACMKGAPLNSSLISFLVNTPASSLAELEKIFEIAVTGSNDDKISAASILCGASLIRGWNVQEHTIRFVVKLLAPAPVDDCRSDVYLISHAPVLDVVLTGISSLDCVQIFSFHGLVPELAGALMPICEIFGSCDPNSSWTLSTGEQVSAHAVFSSAFTILLRLWRFNHPPAECCVMGDGAPAGSQLTPDYLLLLRNSLVVSSSGVAKKRDTCKSNMNDASSRHPIFVDSFPKLKAWYQQHQACLASAVSGRVHGTAVHHNVDILLTMMLRKVNREANQSAGPGASGSSSLSNSSEPVIEDASSRPRLHAWDIMEAVPFVVDAALTACAHGRLSPRELATGLKELADFLPASLATIACYFSAEVTRGVWKHVYMNGSDWPSPGANLSTVEEEIKKIVAATGADVPSLVTAGSLPATLPLPLAAFLSVTITYKLDKGCERFLFLAGSALGSLASSCPWPSMPIVSALWAQKVKRWHDFLMFAASGTVFHHNNGAVAQLLKSCFSALLGFSPIHGSGIGSLLGHGFCSHFSGGCSPVAPGILYLRIHRNIKDIILLMEQVLSLLMFSVRELAGNSPLKETREKLKTSKYRMAYGQVSLVSALTQVKVAASLGAMLVWLSGGSGLVRYLFQEMLPSWFLSVHESDQGANGGMVAMLEGYGLAYFAMLCGMFAWGTDSTSAVSKRRPKTLGYHLGFVADAVDGKFSLGCNMKTWRAYVLGFLGLMVDCLPSWVLEVELGLLKRLSGGLRKWNEGELAILLLEKGGLATMGAAAELILSGE